MGLYRISFCLQLKFGFFPNPTPAKIFARFLDLAGFEKSAMLPDSVSQLIFLKCNSKVINNS